MDNQIREETEDLLQNYFSEVGYHFQYEKLPPSLQDKIDYAVKEALKDLESLLLRAIREARIEEIEDLVRDATIIHHGPMAKNHDSYTVYLDWVEERLISLKGEKE